MTLRHIQMGSWRKQLYKFAIVDFLFSPIDDQR